MALETLYFGAERAHRVRRRPGARRGDAVRRAARRRVLLLHAPAGQGRGLRQRARAQGAGRADGRGAARARRRAARPTTPPTRSRSRSATPTTRRSRSALAAAARMIAMLRGEVAERGADHVTLMCGGVGYRLAVSAQTLAAVGPVGGEATLHTHLIVRDDALVLVGFASEAERDLFLALLGVQAVGPKLALAVLGAGPVGAVVGAIAAGDARFFQAVPGRRQAHRRADHRRAAREGRRGARRGDRRAPGDRRRRAARAGARGAARARLRAARGRAAAGRAPTGETAEELLAAALRGDAAGGARAR